MMHSGSPPLCQCWPRCTRRGLWSVQQPPDLDQVKFWLKLGFKTFKYFIYLKIIKNAKLQMLTDETIFWKWFAHLKLDDFTAFLHLLMLHVVFSGWLVQTVGSSDSLSLSLFYCGAVLLEYLQYVQQRLSLNPVASLLLVTTSSQHFPTKFKLGHFPLCLGAS